MTRCLFFNESIHGGDDLTLVLCCKHRWPLKAGGVGERSPPPFVNKRIRTEFAYCKHRQSTWRASIDGGDDLTIRTEFAYCKHKRSTWRRADACFLVQASMAFKSGGVGGGAQPPPFANKMIRTAFPSANINDPHDDDQMPVFSASMDGGDDLTLDLFCKHRWPLKSGGVGGRRPPHLQTKSARPSPMNLGGTKRPRPRRDKTMTNSRVPA